jgi:hypothetical protein
VFNLDEAPRLLKFWERFCLRERELKTSSPLPQMMKNPPSKTPMKLILRPHQIPPKYHPQMTKLSILSQRKTYYHIPAAEPSPDQATTLTSTAANSSRALQNGENRTDRL